MMFDADHDDDNDDAGAFGQDTSGPELAISPKASPSGPASAILPKVSQH